LNKEGARQTKTRDYPAHSLIPKPIQWLAHFRPSHIAGEPFASRKFSHQVYGISSVSDCKLSLVLQLLFLWKLKQNQKCLMHPWYLLAWFLILCPRLVIGHHSFAFPGINPTVMVRRSIVTFCKLAEQALCLGPGGNGVEFI
jgi:hypothetical protein